MKNVRLSHPTRILRLVLRSCGLSLYNRHRPMRRLPVLLQQDGATGAHVPYVHGGSQCLHRSLLNVHGRR